LDLKQEIQTNENRLVLSFIVQPISVEHRQLSAAKPEAKEAELWEEQCIVTLADLQERQMTIFNSTQQAVFDKVC
jgi:hypothetical protein